MSDNGGQGVKITGLGAIAKTGQPSTSFPKFESYQAA
jgi:hypothetical protein